MTCTSQGRNVVQLMTKLFDDETLDYLLGRQEDFTDVFLYLVIVMNNSRVREKRNCHVNSRLFFRYEIYREDNASQHV
jgi:hypothetical protein